MAQFGHRVAQRVVDGAKAQLPTMDVGDGDVEWDGGHGCRVHLETIPQYDQNVGPVPRQGLRHPGRAPRHGECDVLGCIPLKKHGDAFGDGEPFRFDFADGQSKTLGQMHARYVQPQTETGILLDGAQDRAVNTEVRARHRHHADASQVGITQGLTLPLSTVPLPGVDSRVA